MLINLLVTLAILIFLFLAFREIALWYWKINDITRLLTRIANALEGKEING